MRILSSTRHAGLAMAFTAVTVLTTLTGCGKPVREEIFRTDGPTTEEVWHGASRRSPLLDETVGFNHGGSGPGGVAGWTRDARNELSALFPELRNPRILLYIYPHLSARGAPVPGYTTVFPLYEDALIHALPSEAFRQRVWP